MSMEISVQRPNVIWRQVADQIRARILSGSLSAGTKLPSTADIAQGSGTDVKTVHRALTGLVREGLITRTRKVGTYVTDRQAELSRIGIYHSFQVQFNPPSLFQQHLLAQIHKQSHQAGIVTRSFVDQRPASRQTTAPADLEKAARERQIQGLITTIGDPAHQAWLRKLPIPVAYSSGDFSTSVRSDILHMLEQAIRRIRRQGGRSVGVISPFRDSYTAFYRSLREKLRENGMITHDDWLCRPEVKSSFTEEDYDAFGYEAFRRLWSQKKRPDGLIAYPDSMVTGVIMGILSCQVKVPQDLKLVLHKNDLIDYFCPLPATFVVSSVPETARMLLKQVRDAFHGRPTARISIDFSLQSQSPGLPRGAVR